MSTANSNAQPRRALPALLWGIVARPRATLEYLAHDGKRLWWVLALLTIVLMVIPIFVSAPVEARQVQPSPLPPGAIYPDPMMEAPLPTGPNPATIALRVIGRIVGVTLTWLLWAVGLHLASVFMGRSSTFGQMFRTTVWAWIPYAVRGLLQTIFISVSQQPIVNAGLSGFVIDKSAAEMNLIPPGPGQLALAAVLAQVDVFLFWNLLLLITGLIAVTRLSRKKAVIATLVLWAVLMLLNIIPALLSGMFSGGGRMFM